MGDEQLTQPAEEGESLVPGLGIREIGSIGDDSEDENARTGIFKAGWLAGQITSEEVQTTNAKPIEDALARQTFRNAGALLPPFDPETLCRLLENSGILRQNIDAYVTNIDAFGHRLEPVIDLDADDADEKIASALMLEELIRQEEVISAQANTLGGDAEAVEDLQLVAPDPATVQLKKQQIRTHMLLEEHRINSLLGSCSYDMSFVTLRRRSRMDLELMGNSYWEVQRNRLGRIAQFTYLYGFTMRLIPLDREFVEVPQRVQITPLKWEKRMLRRRFRRFVQVYENQVVYFKEFGDPRVISSRTGRVYSDLEALKLADPSDPPATEVLHFKIHSPRSPYGVPRWAGALLSVLGSRQADEINFLYFENKAVPPLALLVSGGRVSAASTKKLEDTIREKLKGKKNFHNILIIEAEPTGNGSGVENISRMKIELKPLTDAMFKDALFMGYGERNQDVVGQSFRLPRLLRGDIRDFNKATADAALDFTEAQVFHPEREEFDWEMDVRVLGDMGIRYWKFRSNAPSTRDPTKLAAIIEGMTNAGILTPEEARMLSADVFNKALKKVRAAWTKQPLALTIAGVPVQEDAPPGDGMVQSDPLQDPETATDPLGVTDPGVSALPDAAAAVAAMRATAAGGAATAAGIGGVALPAGMDFVAQVRALLGKTGGKMDGKMIRKLALARRKSTGSAQLDAVGLLEQALNLMQVRDALATIEQAAIVQKFKADRSADLVTEVIRVPNIREFITPHGEPEPAPAVA